MSKTPPEEVGREALAKILGLTPQRVGQLAEEGAVRRTARGSYDLAASVQGYVVFKLKAQADEMERAAGESDFERHRARLYKAKADAAELDLALRFGQVIHAEIAEAFFTDSITKMRAKILTIPTRCAPQLEGQALDAKRIHLILKEACHEALAEVADYDPQPVIDEFNRRYGWETPADKSAA